MHGAHLLLLIELDAAAHSLQNALWLLVDLLLHVMFIAALHDTVHLQAQQLDAPRSSVMPQCQHLIPPGPQAYKRGCPRIPHEIVANGHWERFYAHAKQHACMNK